MPIASAREGLKGFDCNRRVTYDEARAFFDHGYRFIMRYVPRVVQADHDLTAREAQDLHRAGLAIGIVQHVPAPGWTPDETLGLAYGHQAIHAAKECGAPNGVPVWADLEGVSSSATSAQTTLYAKAWWRAAADDGAEPGLYVGWRPGINAHDLYYRLPFRRYWSGYNLNKDQYPIVRGVQMKQREAGATDWPSSVKWLRNAMDVNLVLRDNLGDLPVFWAPDEWDN